MIFKLYNKLKDLDINILKPCQRPNTYNVQYQERD